MFSYKTILLAEAMVAMVTPLLSACKRLITDVTVALVFNTHRHIRHLFTTCPQRVYVFAPLVKRQVGEIFFIIQYV